MHYLPTHHETNDPDFQQLSDFVVAEMRRLSVPGVAIGLIHNGREMCIRDRATAATAWWPAA